LSSSSLLAAFGAALAAGCLVIPAVRALALRLGAIDLPGRRRLHREDTPRLGGLVVFAGVLAGVTAGLLTLPGGTAPAVVSPLVTILLISTAIVGIGFLDDIRNLDAPVKLAVEIAVSAALWSTGLRIEQLALPGVGTWVLGGAASFLATVLWLVAVTNAFNLIDGVNGLAGGVAVITAAGLLALGWLAPAPVVILLVTALVGGVLAFLRQNLRPGGIFLGDSGSLFLGFILAAASLELGRRAGGAFFPGGAVLLMGMPLVEVGTTVVRRSLASRALRLGPAGFYLFLRRDLMRPDAGHLHHCLIRRGLRAGMTSLFLIGTAFFYCLIAVGFVALPRVAAPAWGVAAAVTVVCLGVCRPLAPTARARASSSARPVVVARAAAPPLAVILGGAAAGAPFARATGGIVAPLVARQARAVSCEDEPDAELEGERLAA
jgi:UDP-GlcNAc:undecaprenyl-phosphate GlcNAc-1-phosphate transferase